MNTMYKFFREGDVLYGYCNGFFGRDSYAPKICVMVRAKYAVFEYDGGNGTVLNISDSLSSEGVSKWKLPESGNYD